MCVCVCVFVCVCERYLWVSNSWVCVYFISCASYSYTYIENLGCMVPDSWYSIYHYSHPPLVERLRAITSHPLYKSNSNSNSGVSTDKSSKSNKQQKGSTAVTGSASKKKE